jgi:phosphomannomutase
VGTVLSLQHLLEFNGTLSELKATMPEYYIVKNKIEIDAAKAEHILTGIIDKYSSEKINIEDGIRIDFEDHWVQIRKSNTEPILRIIVEAKTLDSANKYMVKYMDEVKELL